MKRLLSRVRIGCVIVVVGLLANCGGNDRAETASPEASGESGEQLYLNHCASCHGSDLRGTDKGPSHLSIVYEPDHHPDDAFRSAVRNGVTAHHWEFGDMAPIPGLTDDAIDAIVAYVRTTQERNGFEPYPPP